MSEMPDDLISVAEAARRVGIDPSTVRRYINAGLLPAVRVGPKIWRVRVADLEKITIPSSAPGDSE